jgi:hypothetical protein
VAFVAREHRISHECFAATHLTGKEAVGFSATHLGI